MTAAASNEARTDLRSAKVVAKWGAGLAFGPMVFGGLPQLVAALLVGVALGALVTWLIQRRRSARCARCRATTTRGRAPFGRAAPPSARPYRPARAVHPAGPRARHAAGVARLRDRLSYPAKHTAYRQGRRTRVLTSG